MRVYACARKWDKKKEPSRGSSLDLLRFSRQFRSRLCGGSLVNLDSRLLFSSHLATLGEASSSYAKEDDDGDKRPCSLLEEVSGAGSTHDLVTAGKTSSQTTTFAVLNKHKEGQQDSCNNDEDCNKYVHNII